MTENELRQKVVEQAKGWLGRKEADGSHKEIIDVYNTIRPLPRGYKMKYTDPWCAAFVSAVGSKLGLTAVILPECSCDAMIAAYKKLGRWYALDDALPVALRSGDLIFYDWDKNGSSDHVGLIVEVTSSGYRVIEGNMSDAVGYRTVLRSYGMIKGFCVPNYAAAASATASESTAATATTEIVVESAAAQKASSARIDFSLGYRTLRYGSSGEDVRAVQRNLKAMGFDIGRYGTDGKFGNDTKQAVIAYQKSVRLSADGIVGPQTMAALTGGSV